MHELRQGNCPIGTPIEKKQTEMARFAHRA
jgi:hypothetical protein